ncbi:hypothetical protein [Megamonas funiformis]
MTNWTLAFAGLSCQRHVPVNSTTFELSVATKYSHLPSLKN